MGRSCRPRAICVLAAFIGKERLMNTSRPFAIVTGASSGIGLELAREAAMRGYDLLIAADRPLDEQAPSCAPRRHVDTVEADLATREGVEMPLSAGRQPACRRAARQCRPRPRQGFLDQDSPRCST
jgi:NAD(P)-dependent dehydrogenase (short-subunit alcohol dehydrogenase family)